MSTITAYLAIIKSKNIVDLRTKSVEVLKSHLDSTVIQHEMRRRTNADLAQAESRLARGNADKLASQVDYNVALSTYRRLVGAEPIDLSMPNLKMTFRRILKKLRRWQSLNIPMCWWLRLTLRLQKVTFNPRKMHLDQLCLYQEAFQNQARTTRHLQTPDQLSLRLA